MYVLYVFFHTLCCAVLYKATQFYFPAVGEDGSKCSSSDLVHMLYLPPVQLQTAEDERDASPGSFPLVLIIHGGPQVNAYIDHTTSHNVI